MRLRGLGLGRVRVKIPKIRTRGYGGANFALENWLVRISHKWSSVVRISHNALFTCARCEICGSFKWQKFMGFEGGKC